MEIQRSLFMKVAVLDDYQNVALEMADWTVLSPDIEVVVFDEHYSGTEFLSEMLKDFGIIVAMRERTPFDRELLEKLPNLKLLITTGMRNASIDLTAAGELGIPVCGTRGGGPATAELAWGIILSLFRSIPGEDASVKQGGWQRTLGIELKGKVLGLLGLGKLGSHMAVIGNAFGMEVIAWSQNLTAEKAAECHARLVSKDELCAWSDVLSIHTRLGDRTVGLLGEHELGLMKPTAFLVNTSRGPIIDEAALIAALESRSIAGAGIDVFHPEPLPADHPFRRLDNTVVTPHIGYVTQEAYRVFFTEAIEDINSWLAGSPLRLLTP
jgi:phosphoglycerate dehydrogenase-like enzyme